MMNNIDLKVEVLAAEWIEAGIPEESIVIKSLGILHRSQRADVIDHSLDEDETLFATERQVLYTSREGLYDMLPQTLFHQPTPPKNANEHEVLDYFKRHKKEEKNARLFFLPFETGINQAKINNVLSELTLQKRGQDARLQNMFAGYWPLLRLLNNSQCAYFLKLLPVFHEIRGKQALVEEVMSNLIELPLRLQIVAGKRQWLDSEEAGCNHFGQVLGINFIPGEPYFFDGEDKIMLHLGPVYQGEAAQYINTQSKRYQLLQTLCDYLLPVHLDWELQLSYHQEVPLMTLPNDGNEESNIVLGTNSLLR